MIASMKFRENEMKKKKRYSIFILTVLLAVQCRTQGQSFFNDSRMAGKGAVLQESDCRVCIVSPAGSRQRLRKTDSLRAAQKMLQRRNLQENIGNRAVSSVFEVLDKTGESSIVWENAGVKSWKSFFERRSKRGPPQALQDIETWRKYDNKESRV